MHIQPEEKYIIISPLDDVPGVVSRHEKAHVIGLLGPEMPHPALPVPDARRLKLSFHDVSAAKAGFQPPGPEHVRALIDFVHSWRAHGQGPLIVHCWMGVSRSPAAAFIARCVMEPKTDEMAIAQALRRIAPFATPNARLVALADSLLARQGRMTAAIEHIGRGQETARGDVVIWR